MTVTEVQAENTIPNGKYTFVGIDIDTTGRRILDEVKYYNHRFYYNGFFFHYQFSAGPRVYSKWL